MAGQKGRCLLSRKFLSYVLSHVPSSWDHLKRLYTLAHHKRCLFLSMIESEPFSLSVFPSPCLFQPSLLTRDWVDKPFGEGWWSIMVFWSYPNGERPMHFSDVYGPTLLKDNSLSELDPVKSSDRRLCRVSMLSSCCSFLFQPGKSNMQFEQNHQRFVVWPSRWILTAFAKHALSPDSH